VAKNRDIGAFKKVNKYMYCYSPYLLFLCNYIYSTCMLFLRHAAAVQALEDFKTVVESAIAMLDSYKKDGVDTVSEPNLALRSTFDLTGRKASDLWSSCLEIRKSCDGVDTTTDGMMDKSQLIDFSLCQNKLANELESAAFPPHESIDLLQSFLVEGEKERTRAVNRLRRFGSDE